MKLKKILIAILVASTLVVVFPKQIGIAIFSIGTVLSMLAQGMNPFQ